jgi:hypothetical protein
MPQSASVYAMSSALESLEPWLAQQLPDLDAVARRRFTHLVAGIIEQQSLLLRQIAAASPFQAEAVSNFTQVQRIIRDTRLTLEQVYYPLVRQLLAQIPPADAYVTIDQTCHTDLYNVVVIGWASDGVSLPLGFLIYPTNGAWAEDARALLPQIQALFPAGQPITLLADRAYASDALIAAVEALGWQYLIRLPEDTLIQHPDAGWVAVRDLRQRAQRQRFFSDVRIWKGATRTATVCLSRQRTADGRTTTWYVVTNLVGDHTCFLAYACRWWQECTHKLLKSGMFNWEGGRVVIPERVTVLLMAAGAACWAVWLLGRAHEHRSRRKPTTTRSQTQRQCIIKRGWDILQTARKQRRMPVIGPPMAPRVLTYQRSFPGFRLPCDASMVELW